MRKLKKIFLTIRGAAIKPLNYLNADYYMRHYSKYLKEIGIQGDDWGYIDPSCWFDGTDYSLITIGSNTTISKEVMFLTHDMSLNRGFAMRDIEGKYLIKKGITIGENCFIGARTSILPGAKIGNNCIIGACSVVKGTIPDNSICVGNPAKVIMDMDTYVDRRIEKEDYVRLY